MADPAMPDPGAAPVGGATSDAPGKDDQGTDDQAGGQVLLTVMVGADGSYTLIKGDEGDDSSGTDMGAAPGGGGAGDATASGAGESQGQQFSDIGSLLKGVLDILKEHEASASGDGSEDDNFNAGYSGGAGGAPTMKQPPASMRS